MAEATDGVTAPARAAETVAVALGLGLFALVCFASQSRTSVTIDEFAHVPAGYFYWRTGNLSLHCKNPPLVKLIMSLPLRFLAADADPDLGHFPIPGWRAWRYGDDFMRRNLPRYRTLLAWSRAMVILMATALGLCLYVASRRRNGPWGAFLSLSVFAMCPNVIAHSGVATLDIGTSFFMLLAVLALRSYLEAPRAASAARAGLTLGLALAARFSAVALAPFYLLTPLLALWWDGERATARRLLARCGEAILLVIVALAVLAACYGFKDIGVPLGRFPLENRLLLRVQRLAPSFPSPLPAQCLIGVDGMMHEVETGSLPNYLAGEWYSGLRPSYLFVAALVKVPIATQLLLLLALGSGLGAFKPGGLRFDRGELFLMAVMAWLFGAFAWSRIQIGIRYALPVFPLAALLIGRLGRLMSGSRLLRAAIGTLLAWLAISTMASYPHYLAYFNGFVRDRAGQPPILLASNVDWGQDLPELAASMRRLRVDTIELAYFGHVLPEIYGVSYRPLGARPHAGYVAISAQILYGAGFYPYPQSYTGTWSPIDPLLVEPFRHRAPIGMAGRSIFIFRNDAG